MTISKKNRKNSRPESNPSPTPSQNDVTAPISPIVKFISDLNGRLSNNSLDSFSFHIRALSTAVRWDFTGQYQVFFVLDNKKKIKLVLSIAIVTSYEFVPISHFPPIFIFYPPMFIHANKCIRSLQKGLFFYFKIHSRFVFYGILWTKIWHFSYSPTCDDLIYDLYSQPLVNKIAAEYFQDIGEAATTGTNLISSLRYFD